ncbi:MAG TPA: type I phosphomannose isomerase catalytic subunit [Planctomycetota bacterium]|nr:type I phosphomannose isomerase catalytic subunit [Planctomycetota bacterium]
MPNVPDLRPCLLERKLLSKVWGGRALEQVLGIALPGQDNIGESWELYDRPDGSSRLRGSDTTLRQWMQQHARALLGNRGRPGFGGYFPLLIKYVDAHAGLSVQVHPDDAQAACEHDGGKNEAWVVMHAGPRARIIHGCKPEVTHAQLASAAAGPAVEQLLCSFRPEVGDCIHVPAGTVHALGPDVVVFEVQQNSDVTYRLYDWGREREVHRDKALAVARVDAVAAGRPSVPPRPLPGGGELLLAAPHFRLRRLTFDRRCTLSTQDAFAVFNVVAGRGMLGWHSGGADAPLLLQRGDCALVPACIPEVFLSPIGTMQVLVSDPGMVP